MKVIVSEKFKTDLITGILSVPIIYIPHFHYSYVDQAIKDIIPEQFELGVLGLKRTQILEFGMGKTNPIDLISKTPYKNYSTSFEFKTDTFGALLSSLIKSSNKVPDAGTEKDNAKGPFSCGVDKDEKMGDFRIFLVKNIAKELEEPAMQYLLQEFASKYERGEYPPETTIIMVSPNPVTSLPSELEKFVTVVDVPNPEENDIRRLVETEIPISAHFNDKNTKESLVSRMTRAMMGLQLYEIEQIIRSVRVRTGGRLTEKALEYALEEKKSIVRKTGIIEVVDTEVSFSDVGGLNVLRKDLENKRVVFDHLNDYQNKKMPLPKGILVLGMPGCGKSLIAKAIAKDFNLSLLKLDVGRLMGQYVGQSEENLRKALRTAEAAHPCVLWIDEIEKAFAGAGNGSGNDLVMRLMGHFLTWMQERKSPIYIVATANDALRPELMRKGRFDEVYFVDFPNEEERIDILKKKISKYKKPEYSEIMNMDKLTDEIVKEIAKKMVGAKQKEHNGFSGAEIESVVCSVVEDAFVACYKDAEKRKKDSGKPNEELELRPVTITKDIFDKKIDGLSESVMCEQVRRDNNASEDSPKEKTPVDRIRELQNIYHFKSATTVK